jgi:hypothetical protein
MRCAMVRHRSSDVLPAARAGGGQGEWAVGDEIYEKSKIFGVDKIGEKTAPYWVKIGGFRAVVRWNGVGLCVFICGIRWVSVRAAADACGRGGCQGN